MNTQFDITGIKADANGNVSVIDWMFTATEGEYTSTGTGTAVITGESVLAADANLTKQMLVDKLIAHHGGQSFVDNLTQFHQNNLQHIIAQQTAVPVNYGFLTPAPAAVTSQVSVLEPVNLP